MKLVAGAIFLVVVIAVYGAIGSHFSGDSAILTRYAVVAALSFLAILAHELGHAAAVLMFGGRVKSIVVLPLRYRPATRKLSLTWRPKGTEIGGFVTYELDRIGARGKHAAIALAGPLANVLLSLISACVVGLIAQGVAAALLTALAVLSFGMAIVNLIPFKGSDGRVIFQALRTKPRRGGIDQADPTVSLERHAFTP